MFQNRQNKPKSATQKQLNCIEVMNNIISKDLNFNDEEKSKREKFLEDYKEVQKAIEMGKFTIGTTSYIIKKWMSFSYEIRDKYLWTDYGSGDYGSSWDVGLYEASDVFLTEMFY